MYSSMRPTPCYRDLPIELCRWCRSINFNSSAPTSTTPPPCALNHQHKHWLPRGSLASWRSGRLVHRWQLCWNWGRIQIASSVWLVHLASGRPGEVHLGNTASSFPERPLSAEPLISRIKQLPYRASKTLTASCPSMIVSLSFYTVKTKLTSYISYLLGPLIR